MECRSRDWADFNNLFAADILPQSQLEVSRQRNEAVRVLGLRFLNPFVRDSALVDPQPARVHILQTKREYLGRPQRAAKEQTQDDVVAPGGCIEQRPAFEQLEVAVTWLDVFGIFCLRVASFVSRSSPMPP